MQGRQSSLCQRDEARGNAIKPLIDCPKYDCKEFTDVPYLEAVASYDEEKQEVALFCVNRSMDESIELDISLLGFEGYKAVHFESMDGYDVKKENTFAEETVTMHDNALPSEDGKNIVCELKPLSFNVLRFKK